jgi:hypothetical protein
MKFNEREIQEFKTLLFKSIRFIIVFIILDVALGFIAKEVFFSQETGKYSRMTYSIEKDSSDILVMGSSHANRHYVPEVIEKQLGMSCYNAGVLGQKMIFHAALQKMILKNHKPKYIILNIDKDWMYEAEDAYERIADLHPYYNDYKTELEPIFSLNSKFTSLKLMLNSYQTNSTIVHAIKYFVKPQQDFNGYVPLNKKMSKPQTSEVSEANTKREEVKTIDPNFVSLFKDFIANAKEHEVQLIFAISPRVKPIEGMKDNSSLKTMTAIADENNIPLIDFTYEPVFIEQYELFNDSSHLNHDGAIIFSKLLSDKIKSDVFKSL